MAGTLFHGGAIILIATLLPVASFPAQAGSGLERAAAILRTEVEQGKVGAAALLVARHGKVLLHEGYGRLNSDPGAPQVKPDSVFLLASITKPVTACSLMLLVERGKVRLDDPVERYLPEFTGGERGRVRVRDLLSHISGLPDMLPENIDLRREHAPLSEFVRHTFTTPLLFSPRTQFKYQSMGILLAAVIVERTTGMRLRDFEKREIFEPLGMQDSSLGLGGRRIEDLVRCGSAQGAVAADEASFGPNSAYWRDFGCPWGGIHSTTSDIAALLQTFLDGGVHAGKRVFRAETVAEMTRDQNTGLNAPWGLGWALGRSISWNGFGGQASPRVFGHAGATGTVAWADPDSGLLCVVLTNRPYAVDDGNLLRQVSTAVAASIH